MVRKHGAAPSAVLQRCDIGTGRLTVLLKPPKPSQPGRAQPPTSMLRLAPWHAVPQLGSCASAGHAWRLWAARHAQEEVGSLGAQPLPRVLEPAASKAADFTASDHPGPPWPFWRCSMAKVLPWWRHSLLPWPPGVRGYEHGLLYALQRSAYSGSTWDRLVSLCQSRSFHGLLTIQALLTELARDDELAAELCAPGLRGARACNPCPHQAATLQPTGPQPQDLQPYASSPQPHAPQASRGSSHGEPLLLSAT